MRSPARSWIVIPRLRVPSLWCSRAGGNGTGRVLRALAAGAFALVAAGCASTGARPQPFPTPGGPAAAPSPPAPTATGAPGVPVDGYAIATAALAFQGTPYRSGGADPGGFDCSGFVQYVLGASGLRWPRLVREQFAVGHAIAPDDIQPGDLVFFATESREVSHVGIAIGGDRFVHAPSSRGVVRVESLGSDYWSRHFVGARRAVSTRAQPSRATR